MANQNLQRQLLAKATSGDAVALQQLLVEYYDQLAKFIAPKIPATIQAVVSPDDIVQQTFVIVFREIDAFTPRSDQSFEAWLKKIAHNCTQDAIRRLRSTKRGGNYRQVRRLSLQDASSVADLVDELSAGSHTPSGSAVRHEAVVAVREAINALPEDYYQAVTLRLLDGRSLQESATIMNRSPRAVQGLVDRAKTKMRAALGSFSLYQ